MAFVASPAFFGGSRTSPVSQQRPTKVTASLQASEGLSRRHFFIGVTGAAVGSLLFRDVGLPRTNPASAQEGDGGAEFVVAPLPYPIDALEPAIDSKTMEVHHDKHYATYTKNLNAALKSLGRAGVKPGSGDEKSIAEIFASLNSVSDAATRSALRNNGGGWLNHTLFFAGMQAPRENNKPSGRLAKAIEEDFGSFEDFAELFSKKATTVFGSGWAWLYRDKDTGKLVVNGYPNQDSPLLEGHKPLLGIDVWEHAYYLRYQNRRPEYIKNFFNVINWSAVEARL